MRLFTKGQSLDKHNRRPTLDAIVATYHDIMRRKTTGRDKKGSDYDSNRFRSGLAGVYNVWKCNEEEVLSLRAAKLEELLRPFVLKNRHYIAELWECGFLKDA